MDEFSQQKNKHWVSWFALPSTDGSTWGILKREERNLLSYFDKFSSIFLFLIQSIVMWVDMRKGEREI